MRVLPVLLLLGSLSVPVVCLAEAPQLEFSARGEGIKAPLTRSGWGVAVGSSAPLKPWLRFGGELAWVHYGRPSGFAVTLDSTVGDGPLDSADLVTLTGMYRLMPPNTDGVRPFLLTGSGLSAFRPGTRHDRWTFPGPYVIVEDPAVWALCSEFGVGLRGGWGRRNRGFEFSVRLRQLWSDESRQTVGAQLGVVF